MTHANDSRKMEGLWGLILKVVICLLLAFTSTVAAATDYYVSPSGSDAAVGTSGFPWQTIARVNGQDLDPGDRVLFQGGATFAGNLLLDASDSGTPASPVVITSFGEGRATIYAGDGNGIYAYDCGGIEIRDLHLVGAGPGVEQNDGTGVYFYTDRTDGTKFEHIQIDQVDASGFRRAGIGIKSNHSSLPGYRNVEITRCKAFNNGRTGIQVGGYYDNSTPALSHEDVLIAHCEVFDNRGDPTVTNNHTGSGILLSATNGAVIEFCHAYNNGEYNSSNSNGPVGIWAWQANDVIIQFNISNDNKSGSNKDGGGFDFDGGMTNSIMQYNYSYENQGPGYLLAQFGGLYGAPPYHDNVFRYNISYNDGRGNNGGFLLWAGASISNIDIYGNTIYLTPRATGIPTPVGVFSGNYSNISVRNNIFMTGPGLPLIRSNPDLSGPDPEIHFQGNAYWTTDGGFEIEAGGNYYYSLAAWQNSGQEKQDGLPVGLHGDPKLVNPTSPELLTDPTQLAMLSAFKLQPDSPVIDAGLNLLGNFGVDPGLHDFYGVPLPQGAALDIGAAEHSGSNPNNTTPPIPDPMTWAIPPFAAGANSISMTATTASDENGVEYYFMCTTGGCQDSGWQDSPAYEDFGLQPETQYTYQVKARDKSANQNETGWSNTATASISVINGSYALSFDGDDDVVRAGEVPGIGPLTVEAWLNPKDDNADGLVIVGSEGVRGWAIEISSGQLIWWLITNQGWQTTQHPTLFQAGQWYHIATTFDNGSAQTFVNGVASIAASVGTLTQGPSLTIGGFEGYSFFNGMIDEVRISNNVRYTSDFVPPTGSFSPDANTLGLWHFDEGEGQIASDTSSSANDFTLGNTDDNDSADPIWVDSYVFGNDAPVAEDLTVTTEEGTAVAIILIGSDPDGDPLTFTVKSGPSSGTLSGTAPDLTYTPDAGFTGIDSLTYIANDGEADSNEATVTITVSPENQAPIVEAGPAQTVTLPDSASLDGTVTDDGLPAGSTLTTTWSLQSGDGTVTFGNSAAVDTTASFSDDGTYVLRLEATDGNKSAFDEVTITVNPDIQAPSPNPPTWATAPDATGTSSISMTASAVVDPSGVEYYFEEMSGNPGGSDSGWQNSDSYTDTGLNAVTKYNYRIQARDQSANQNQTVWSSELSATTDAEAPKSGCGAAPMYADSGQTNLSASNSVGNALLPLLPSMMALGLWRVKRGAKNRKKR